MAAADCATTEDLLEVVLANYGLVAKDMIAPMLKVLAQAHRAFDGDLEKFQIVMLVALRSAEAESAPGYSIGSGPPPAIPSLGTNAKSVADSTGIPRETVRRKVVELIEAGWIARDRDGRLVYTLSGFERFAKIRDPLLRCLLAHYRTVAMLA